MAASNSHPEHDLASLGTQTHPAPPPKPHPDPDYPAESFRLPPEAELEWLDRSVAAAAIYERDDSTKGTANPKAQHLHQNGGGGDNNQNQQHRGSNRFSGPLRARKSAILGLPKPIERHSGYLDRRGKPGKSTAMFSKKSKGKGKVEEPGSPKVSWFGKVGSDRERHKEEKRRMRREAKEFEHNEERREEAAAAGRGRGRDDKSKGQFWSCLLGRLACCRGNTVAVGSVEEDAERRTSASSSDKNKVKDNKGSNNRMKNNHRTSSPESSPRHSTSLAEGPPGLLGGLNRFTSGRRPSSWGGGEFDASGEFVIGAGGGGLHAEGGPSADRQ